MIRRLIQIMTTLATNSYIKGFYTLSIYQGEGKKLCVPVLNCYSCPGAVASCPVGSMQLLLASVKHQVSLYVVGIVTLVGALSGRLVCGWLCPFGLFQELTAKLSRSKFKIPRILSYMKYVILALTLVLPVLWLDPHGLGAPYFCKLLCPAGTLEAGLPLGLGNPLLRANLGWLFIWKVSVLVLFVVASIITYRPFCRTTCPLGAFYGLFNAISLWKLEIDHHSCQECGKCSNNCPLDIDVMDNPNSPECVRCMICKDSCPSGALTFRARLISMKEEGNDESIIC
ncbi:MAG: 4Fe-4S binding protein [Acidobacteriota bacterium]